MHFQTIWMPKMILKKKNWSSRTILILSLLQYHFRIVFELYYENEMIEFHEIETNPFKFRLDTFF